MGQVTFHEKLGTQLERVERIKRLARELAPLVGADPDEAERAAHLAKADLMSETVGEFPELQGIIGRYIALAQGEKPAVADAIAEHYKPQGPSDAVPTNPVSIAVALADKLDMLVGFWAIDEKPTGSKDPFALRRAALGVIRIVLENALRIHLIGCFENAAEPIEQSIATTGKGTFGTGRALVKWNGTDVRSQSVDLLNFFADRLKVHLRDKGARHDLIDAVFALPGQDDLLMVVRRVEALGRFLETEDGASLLALVRRALNILKIEEKKDFAQLRRDARRQAPQGKGREGAQHRHRRGGREGCKIARVGGFRGSHDGAGQTPRSCRRLLRQGHRECGRPRSPAEPADAARANPRAHASDRGLLQDRGITRSLWETERAFFIAALQSSGAGRRPCPWWTSGTPSRGRGAVAWAIRQRPVSFRGLPGVHSRCGPQARPTAVTPKACLRRDAAFVTGLRPRQSRG